MFGLRHCIAVTLGLVIGLLPIRAADAVIFGDPVIVSVRDPGEPEVDRETLEITTTILRWAPSKDAKITETEANARRATDPFSVGTLLNEAGEVQLLYSASRDLSFWPEESAAFDATEFRPVVVVGGKKSELKKFGLNLRVTAAPLSKAASESNEPFTIVWDGQFTWSPALLKSKKWENGLKWAIKRFGWSEPIVPYNEVDSGGSGIRLNLFGRNRKKKEQEEAARAAEVAKVEEAKEAVYSAAEPFQVALAGNVPLRPGELAFIPIPMTTPGGIRTGETFFLLIQFFKERPRL